MGLRLLFCVLFFSWTHQMVAPHNNVFTDPLRDVWIGKIFSDSVWTFAPSSVTNKECTLQGQLYREHLSNNTHWAVRMLDASAISVSGLLDGDLIQYGHPDQCIHTRVPIPNFNTQYCLPTATFVPKKSGDFRKDFFMKSSINEYPPYDAKKSIWDFLRPRPGFIREPRNTFAWGVCIPESCAAEDVETSLNSTLGEAFSRHDIDLEVTLDPLMCYSAKELEMQRLPVLGKVWLFTILGLLLLMVLGTSVDYLTTNASPDISHLSSPIPNEENLVVSFLLIFSFIRNWNRLCSTQDKEEISIVHGLKFLSMCLVIVFHRVTLGIAFAQNMSTFEEMLYDTRYFIVNASSQMLDTFFFLSGFLLAWMLMKKREQSKTPSLLHVIVYRAVRIYPILLTAITFTMWVQPYVHHGPQWKRYSTVESQSCKSHWWHNLLFIATLMDDTDLCIPVYWYLNTDIQLFIISLIIIYVAERFSKYRTAILTTALIVSLIVPSVVLYSRNDFSLMQRRVTDTRDMSHSEYFRKIYVKFYMRAPPYIIGVCAAYLVHASLSKKPFKISGIQKTLIFIICFLVQILMFYIGALLLVPGHQYNVWEHVFFAPFMRGSLGAIIFVCILIHAKTGFGMLSDFLGHPIFTPLSRLTFHMYMVHFHILCWDTLSLHSTPHYSAFTFLLRCCGDIFLTLVLSLGTTLLIESPAGIMRKKLLGI